MSLIFCPLYFVYHDCWNWTQTITNNNGNSTTTTKTHAGHVHFFMPDVRSFESGVSQAYWGNQTYSFSIKDVWGPNSEDLNQKQNYKLIGKPRWYFYVEEYWRRIFIQPWERDSFTFQNGIHNGKTGIKYDASLPTHSFGPFREGLGFMFFDTKINRTLPVEYWKNSEKTKRDCFLKYGSSDDTSGEMVWNFKKNIRSWNRNVYREHFSFFRQNRWGTIYWGDNVIPDSSGQYNTGYNKFEDIVKVDNNGIIKYYRYSYQPFNYNEQTYSSETGRTPDSWPNPPCDIALYAYNNGADFTNNFTVKKGQMREYLYYHRIYDDFLTTYNINDSNIYENLTEDRFNSFVSQKQNKIISDGTVEFLIFDDFISVWEELTEEDIERLKLNGDYPKKNETPLPSTENSAFSSTGNPFFKNGIQVNPITEWKKYFSNREIFTIPEGKTAKGDTSINPLNITHPREIAYTDEDGSRWNYPDNLFLSPIIEYQKVIHRNWERLPEKEGEEPINIYTTDDNFGDNFNISITIPFKKNGIVQSPFSDEKGVVYPVGTYFNDVVKPEDKLRYYYKTYADYEEVKKLRRVETIKFENTITSLSEEEKEIAKNNWFETNWKDKPILKNPLENTFDEETNEWHEQVSHQYITEEQIAKIDIGNNEKINGYYNSNGVLVQGGDIVKFNIPNSSWTLDGQWVEQCLGAIVKAKVVLLFEDSLGYRWTETVEVTEATPQDSFVGTDNE